MEKLGVDRVLTPYETQPWLVYDEDKGITCSAEVRVAPRYDDIQTEIQLLFDEWEEDDEEEEETEGDGEEKLGPDGMPLPPKCKIIDGRQQIMIMCVKPTENLWTTKHLIVKAQDYRNLIPKWEEKGCDFFRACIEALQMGEIPDFDELIASQLADDSGGGRGRRGRIGRKSPKANAQALLGMKKGM